MEEDEESLFKLYVHGLRHEQFLPNALSSAAPSSSDLTRERALGRSVARAMFAC